MNCGCIARLNQELSYPVMKDYGSHHSLPAFYFWSPRKWNFELLLWITWISVMAREPGNWTETDSQLQWLSHKSQIANFLISLNGCLYSQTCYFACCCRREIQLSKLIALPKVMCVGEWWLMMLFSAACLLNLKLRACYFCHRVSEVNRRLHDNSAVIKITGRLSYEEVNHEIFVAFSDERNFSM